MAISRNQNPKQLKGNRKPIPKGNKGLAKLKKVAPQVVAKMGYKKGGLAASLKKLKRSQGSSPEGEVSPRMKRRIDKKIEEEKAKKVVPKKKKPTKPAKPMTPPTARPTKPRGRTGKPKFKGRVYNI